MEKGVIIFVLGKPYKDLESEKGDSLWAFAKIALERDEA